MKSIQVFVRTLVIACIAQPVFSQTSPAYGWIDQAAAPSDAHRLGDYLALLKQISPAVEAGARTYLAAVRLRCGHALDTGALRRAMAQDGGDPILMGLIRAAALLDATERNRLVAQMPCASKAVP